MKLQTHIPLFKQSSKQVDYNSNILLLGSCFVENIGEKFEYFKFQNIKNPFGILFHPKCIENLLVNAVNKKVYSEADVFFKNEQWHCFDAHSKLSSSSKEDLLSSLNNNIRLTNKQIKQSTHLIITLGTAWVYQLVEKSTIVANCHKVDQKQFKKELLSVVAIVQSIKNIVDTIKEVNSEVAIIFTVSPVRHIKDGFIENTQSKAHLITAIHQFLNSKVASVEKNSLFYFPSYEIMMDELRDYRFYNQDMLHPNQTAVDYIWDKFKAVWVAKEAFQVMQEVSSVQKSMRHKSFNLNSEAHQQFVKKTESKKKQLSSKYPHISF